jgi:hypothetical protein
MSEINAMPKERTSSMAWQLGTWKTTLIIEKKKKSQAALKNREKERNVGRYHTCEASNRRRETCY